MLGLALTAPDHHDDCDNYDDFDDHDDFDTHDDFDNHDDFDTHRDFDFYDYNGNGYDEGWKFLAAHPRDYCIVSS